MYISKVVEYDNAYNLHFYCLNAVPTFFKSTQFLADRLHWANHAGEKLDYSRIKSLSLVLASTSNSLNKRQNKEIQ